MTCTANPATRSAVLLSLLLGLCAFGGTEGPETEGGLYIKQLHERVHPLWKTFLAELKRLGAQYQDPSLHAEVIFGIDPDGTIARVETTQRAGLKGFDDAPSDLIRDLRKVPPPPVALRSDDGRVYVRWRFLRREPGCGEAEIIDRRLPLPEAVPLLVAAGKVSAAVARIKEEPPTDASVRDRVFTSMAQALGRAGGAQKDPEQRVAAAAVLGEMRDGEAALIALIADPVPAVRQAALLALSGRTPSRAAIGPLKKLLASAVTEDRAGAARVLYRVGDRSGIEPVRAALAQKADGPGAAAAAAALREMGDEEEVLRIVARLLADSERRASGAAASLALGNPVLAEALLQALPGAAPPLRRTILEALARMVPQVPKEARKALLHSLSDPDATLRAAVMRATPALGDRSLGVRYRLIDALVDPVPDVRAAAAAALVEVGGEPARDELVRAGRDKVPAVRAALLQALKAHPVSSTSALVAHLSEDREVTHVVRAAAGQPDEDATVLTQQLLDAAGPVLRFQAAAAWLIHVRSVSRPTSERAAPAL